MVYVLSKGLPGILNFVAIVIFTRLLSTADYGEYAIALASIGFLNSILFQWIRLGVLRFFPQHNKTEKSKHTFLSTVKFLFLTISVVVLVIGLPVVNFNSQFNDFQIFGTLCIVLLITQSFFQFNLEIVRSELSPILYGLFSLSKALFSLVIGIFLIELGYGPISLIIGLIVGMLIPIIYSWFTTWKDTNILEYDKAIIKILLKYGLPLTVTLSMGMVLNSSDRLLIGWMLGSEEAGSYSVSYDLIQQSLILIMMIINLAAYPLAVKSLENGSVKQAQKQIMENTGILLLASIPATAGIIMLTPNITELMLGSEFRDVANAIIPLISIAVLLQGLKSYHFDLSFQLGEKTNLQMIPVLIAAIINLIFNLLLIPRIGILGAVYSTLISYIFAIVASFIIGNKVFKLKFPLKDFLKIILSTFIMLLPLSLLNNWTGLTALFMQVLSGVLTYLLSIYLFDVLSVRKVVSSKLNKLSDLK
ncbi:oligosaccharide flippase family protein [Halobacillus salinus]|nr:oligosaccharide flippase family protein [Halobacillus salinus]